MGVAGFLAAMGALFELTDGDVKIEQLFCIADGQWAAEWENAVLGRNGRTLETNNMFVYRFEGERIAELSMISAAPAGSESFWSDHSACRLTAPAARMGETLLMGDGVDQGRDAFDRQAWRGAYEHLSAAARDEPLEVEDLERLASAAYLAGHGEESSDVWAQAHKGCARIGEVARAARCAFWLTFALLNNGELARGGGLGRPRARLLDDRKLDCVEQGYLRYAASLRAVFSGDVATALAGFGEAVAMGERYRDPELTTLSRIGQGRCRSTSARSTAASPCSMKRWSPSARARCRRSRWETPIAR